MRRCHVVFGVALGACHVMCRVALGFRVLSHLWLALLDLDQKKKYIYIYTFFLALLVPFHTTLVAQVQIR